MNGSGVHRDVDTRESAQESEKVATGSPPLLPAADGPPFQAFVQVVSVIGSLGISFTLSTAFGCAGATSLMGSSEPFAMAQLQRAARNLNWATAAFAMAVSLSVLCQLLFSSAAFCYTLRGVPKAGRSPAGVQHAKMMCYALVATMSYASLGAIIVAIGFTSEATKVIEKGPGRLVEWIMLGMGLPIFCVWVACLVF